MSGSLLTANIHRADFNSLVSVPANSCIANNSQAQQKGEDLAMAFAQFTALSTQLTESYQNLEDRVAQLTQELNHSASQRLEALQAKEVLADRLENLLDFLPGGVVVLDPRGKISQTNPVAKELLGDPLEGELWRDVIARCFAPRLDDGHEVSTRDGRRVSIATRSLEDHGQIILLTDQTETRALQEKFSRQERLSSMGKMVSALAHQIRTPLSAALLYTGHLNNEKLSVEQRDRFVTKLHARLIHMEQQVRDMLLFVKGDLALNEERSVGEIIQKLQEAAEPILIQQQAKARWRITGSEQLMRCNSDVLVSALMNLINNALQASTESPVIEIVCNASAKECVIAINDHGSGVAADVLAKRGDAFVTTKAQGIGLGLSVVGAVAKAHGGEFNLANRIEGGAVASMQLPLLNNSINRSNRDSNFISN